jgi:iron complex outermembrane receptor protein
MSSRSGGKSLLVWVCLLCFTTFAFAQADVLSTTASFDIPHQSLPTALVAFSKQSGVQVITTGASVAAYKTAGISGRMAVSEGLQALLKGTPLGFHVLGPHTIGVDSKPEPPKHPSSQPEHDFAAPPRAIPEAQTTEVQEIVVTSRKQKESIIDVPESISVLSNEALTHLGVRSFSDYAAKIPDLSFSYGTGSLGFANSRAIAIRGISGAGTTAIYVDETPVDEAMDPRVLDTERLEVLKGPQGTLFGEGSLGGAVRIVPRKPQLGETDVGYSASAGGTIHGASPNYEANFTGNFSPVDDLVAIRTLGFVSHDAGFVTRSYPSGSNDNQGALVSYGGSISALLHFNEQWEVLARVFGQQQQNHGLPVTYAPLPEFEPSSLVMDRTYNIQEYANEHWVMPTVQVNFSGDNWTAVSATSYLDRHVSEAEDATEGTIQASEAFFGYTPEPVEEAWTQSFRTRRLTEELRATVAPGKPLSGTFGVYFSNAHSTNKIGPYLMPGLADSGFFPSNLGWYNDVNSNNRETAIFGELYAQPLDRTTVTLGLRKYWLRQQFNYFADGLFNAGTSQANVPNSQNGVSPKAAIEYKFNHDTSVYTSAAKGFRAGGGTTPLASFCDSDLTAIGLTTESAARYKSDTVWTYEVGAKAQTLDRRVLVTAGLYQINWHDIQQSIFLPTCGYSFTTNAGAARSRGAELEIAGQVLTGLDIRLGVGYDDAKITDQGRSSQPVGSPVHEVPKVTATAAGTYTTSLGANLEGFVSADYSYVGSSLSSISSFYSPLTRPSYSILNLRIGVRRNRDELTMFANNLTDVRANLGDINPVGYVRHDDEGNVLPRVAVTRPLTLGVRYSHSY